MRVWRAWGGKSQYGGTYYTNINPATMSKGAYFDAANLSGTGNTMGWINSGTITDLRGVTMGPVGGGSIMEVVIPNPATQVRIGALSQW